MRNRRIKYYEFEKASRKIWMNWSTVMINDKDRLSDEEFKKYDKICKLYRKQNRFNIFKVFDGMYKNFLPYGKKCLIASKSLLSILILLMLCLFIIPFYQNISLVMLCMMPPLLVILVLQQNWDSKYKKSERDWEYEKKYNPNFERQQKLKRILADG